MLRNRSARKKDLLALRERRTKSIGKRTPLGKKVTVKTGYGPVGVSKGWAGQPFVSTRKEDYPLEPKSTKGRYEQLMINDKPEDIICHVLAKKMGAPKPSSRRKALLRGIVLYAENSAQRFPGADKIARAAVRMAIKKHPHASPGEIFRRVFTGKAPYFAMAAQKGAQAYSRFLSTNPKESANALTAEQEEVFDNLSVVSNGDDVAMIKDVS